MGIICVKGTPIFAVENIDFKPSTEFTLQGYVFWALITLFTTLLTSAEFRIQGTSADQDTRFSNKQAKLLKSQKFAPELDHLVRSCD